MDIRNKIQAKCVMNMLEKKPNTSFFFAFGGAHFFGSNNVLEILQSSGYTATQIGPNDTLTSNNSNENSSGDKFKAKNSGLDNFQSSGNIVTHKRPNDTLSADSYPKLQQLQTLL